MRVVRIFRRAPPQASFSRRNAVFACHRLRSCKLDMSLTSAILRFQCPSGLNQTGAPRLLSARGSAHPTRGGKLENMINREFPVKWATGLPPTRHFRCRQYTTLTFLPILPTCINARRTLLLSPAVADFQKRLNRKRSLSKTLVCAAAAYHRHSRRCRG